MEEIISCLKFGRQDLDPDLTCDYNIIIGDLNYRLDSNYEEYMDKFQDTVTDHIETMDQLKISMRGGNLPIQLQSGQVLLRQHSPKYPGYQESQIHFEPTYKLNAYDNGYKDKKN